MSEKECCMNCLFLRKKGEFDFCGRHQISVSLDGICVCYANRDGMCLNPENTCDQTIKDSGERTTFDTGAVRDMHEGKGRMDLLPWEALIEVSKHCEEGAKKYGERNCEKGIPIHSLIDSAFRHLAKYTIGMDDEPHLRAAAWNILFALYMEQVHPEMQDIPARMQNLDKS